MSILGHPTNCQRNIEERTEQTKNVTPPGFLIDVPTLLPTELRCQLASVSSRGPWFTSQRCEICSAVFFNQCYTGDSLEGPIMTGFFIIS